MNQQLNDSKWQEVYRVAVLEVDPQKLPERIIAARHALEEELRSLTSGSNHHAERQEVENALHALAVLETEARRWQFSPR